MAYEPGTILLVSFPFTDHTTAKQRPVLVVSDARFNNGEDVVVVPLSSRIADDQFELPIQSTEPYFPRTKLRMSSSVKWTKPMAINTSVVVRELGKIPPDVLGKIQNLVKSLFS